MSEPKIVGITNLPTPGAPRSSAGPASPASSSGAALPARPATSAYQPDSPAQSSRTMDLVFKVGFVVALLVAGFFIFRSISMQPMLVQAKSDNSQLKAQLDQAKAENVTARANANELSDTVAQLQNQQKQLQNEATTAKASAEKAAGQLSGLQAQLRQAQSEAAVARANAQKSASELAKLQARLQQPTPMPPPPAPAVAAPAPAAPVAAAVTRSKPLPIGVSFRKAEVGDGIAVLIQNTSESTLSVTTTFVNPTSSASKIYHLVLDSGAVKELGSLGAWKLASGDRIQVESAGYDPIVKTTP